MSWMGSARTFMGTGAGKFVGNAAFSGAMYGAFGYMTYDDEQSDPLNQSIKTGGMMAADIATDSLIMGAGALLGKGHKALGKKFGSRGMDKNFSSAKPDTLHRQGQYVVDKGVMHQSSTPWRNANKGMLEKKFRPKGMMGKGANHMIKNFGTYGIIAATALDFMGVSLSNEVMKGYESGEKKYKEAQRGNNFSLTDTSSRYMQDQLHTLKSAGNIAEFMHN